MSHRKELFLILSFSLCLAAILAVWSQAEGRGQAQATVRYVGALGLDAGTCTDPTLPCKTVQYALDSAEPSDIIKVASGIYAGTNSHGNLVQVAYIDKEITVAGGYRMPGFAEPPDPAVDVTTIDAQGLGRGLVITGPISVTVEGLSITGGDAIGLGGGPGGADVGGGVLVAGATTFFRNNRLVSNACQTCLGGGLGLVDGTVTLQDNQIASNHADSGGGVYILGGSAILKANALQDNTAAGSGGGLCVVASDVLVDWNTVSGNSADLKGGGILLEASTASLMNNRISANSLSGNGGGVYIDGGDVVMTGNTIAGNTSSWNSGGGMYLWHSDAVLTENVITDNAARREGGGLYLTYSPAQLRDNLVQQNSVNGQNYPDGGGGLYLNYSDAIVDGNRLVDNQANDGGAAYLWQSNPVLSNNVIAGNSAGDGGGL
jgi:parallel beta-helix repeat protein